MREFVTSDQHFTHKNVLEFEDRPFQTVEEMNRGLIKSWNDTVSKVDTVFVIGDFCFGKAQDWIEILDQVNDSPLSQPSVCLKWELPAS